MNSAVVRVMSEMTTTILPLQIAPSTSTAIPSTSSQHIRESLMQPQKNVPNMSVNEPSSFTAQTTTSDLTKKKNADRQRVYRARKKPTEEATNHTVTSFEDVNEEPLLGPSSQDAQNVAVNQAERKSKSRNNQTPEKRRNDQTNNSASKRTKRSHEQEDDGDRRRANESLRQATHRANQDEDAAARCNMKI